MQKEMTVTELKSIRRDCFIFALIPNVPLRALRGSYSHFKMI